MTRIRVPEYGGPSVLTIEESPVPVPDSGEVLIDVKSIGVNYADIDQCKGQYRGGPEPPFTPGLEGAGIVREINADSTEYCVGDEVVFWANYGAYADTVTARAEWTAPVPDTLSLREAGGMVVQGLTAHNCLIEWGGLEPGDTVLINAAAGGVGTMAVQIANARGATVVGTASTETKLDLVSELGADYLIQYTEEDIPESVTERVQKGAVDLVLDGVGGQAFKNSMDVLASGGTMVSYGVASGRPPTITTPRLYYRNLTVKGYHMLRASETMYDRVIDGLDSLYQRLKNGEVEPVIGDTYPLSDASQVHEAMLNRSTTGRPVLIPE